MVAEGEICAKFIVLCRKCGVRWVVLVKSGCFGAAFMEKRRANEQPSRACAYLYNNMRLKRYRISGEIRLRNS